MKRKMMKMAAMMMAMTMVMGSAMTVHASEDGAASWLRRCRRKRRMWIRQLRRVLQRTCKKGSRLQHRCDRQRAVQGACEERRGLL